MNCIDAHWRSEPRDSQIEREKKKKDTVRNGSAGKINQTNKVLRS